MYVCDTELQQKVQYFVSQCAMKRWSGELTQAFRASEDTCIVV